MNLRRTQQNLPMDIFSEMLNQFMRGREDESTVDTSLWSPSVDIKEDHDKYTVLADLPGVEDKDLQVTLENNVLTIKGERHLEKKDEQEGFSRVERIQGQFYRRFTLPEAIDGSKIQAHYKKGILEVKIPKREVVQAKKIEIKLSN